MTYENTISRLKYNFLSRWAHIAPLNKRLLNVHERPLVVDLDEFHMFDGIVYCD